MQFRTLLPAAMLAVVPALAAAQSTAPAATGAATIPKKMVISVQPLNAMWSVYSGELEGALSPTVTLGAGASYWGTEDEADGSELGYLSGDVKLRYYPNAVPFAGFSFGASVGATTVEVQTTDQTTGQTTTENATGPSFGIMLDYGWLMGKTQGFYLGLGVGAKKLFVEGTSVIPAYPTARISIGAAF